MDTYNCRSVTNFEFLNRIGEGAYGTVYRSYDITTNEVVALKRLHLNPEIEFPVTSIREIQLLRSIQHPNIVNLKEIVVGRRSESVYLVFEFCEHDLASLVDNMKQGFSESEIKRILIHILKGIEYLHSNFIIHRDLKLSNLLMNNSGQIKLADFGLSRRYGHPPKCLTPSVITLWYRSPEILLGSERYKTSADMWSVGCIAGELLHNHPLLTGKTELEQLKLIFELLGSPSEKIWPGYLSLPNSRHMIKNLPSYRYNNLKKEFPCLSDNGIDFLRGLLAFDPAKRLTATKALNHPYFTESPLPTEEHLMPKFPSNYPPLSTQLEKFHRTQKHIDGNLFKINSKPEHRLTQQIIMKSKHHKLRPNLVPQNNNIDKPKRDNIKNYSVSDENGDIKDEALLNPVKKRRTYKPPSLGIAACNKDSDFSRIF